MHLKPLTVEEELKITIGLIKGLVVGLAPNHTKEELIESLTEEVDFLEGEDVTKQRLMIKKLHDMSTKEFLTFYDEVPIYDMIHDQIIERLPEEEAPQPND